MQLGVDHFDFVLATFGAGGLYCGCHCTELGEFGCWELFLLSISIFN